MGRHTRTRAVALLVILLAFAHGGSAGAVEGSIATSDPVFRGVLVSADQAERRMAACLSSAPLSADHRERHALACQARVAAGRL